jgi:hypothetical protein
MTCTMRIESPPSAKKLSSTETASMRNTCAQTATNASSISFEGATNSLLPSTLSTSGSARRSTFPFELSGSSSSFMKTAGTMYCGRRSQTYLRSSASPAASSAPCSVTT